MAAPQSPGKQRPSSSRSLQDGLVEPPLQILELSSIRLPDDTSAEISNAAYLASYNWSDADQTIIVPGVHRACIVLIKAEVHL
jgi:hypothetical protein